MSLCAHAEGLAFVVRAASSRFLFAASANGMALPDVRCAAARSQTVRPTVLPADQEKGGEVKASSAFFLTPNQ